MTRTTGARRRYHNFHRTFERKKSSRGLDIEKVYQTYLIGIRKHFMIRQYCNHANHFKLNKLVKVANRTLHHLYMVQKHRQSNYILIRVEVCVIKQESRTKL